MYQWTFSALKKLIEYLKNLRWSGCLNSSYQLVDKDHSSSIYYSFFLCKVDHVCQLEEIRNTEEKTRCKLHPSDNHNAGKTNAEPMFTWFTKRNAELFMVHPDLTHGQKYLSESDDLSTGCFPGIGDLEFDSDFTIRTIPLEFEVKRRCSI